MFFTTLVHVLYHEINLCVFNDGDPGVTLCSLIEPLLERVMSLEDRCRPNLNEKIVQFGNQQLIHSQN
jgi:uncharacterized protein YllA (UPF0747 family)